MGKKGIECDSEDLC